jgi:hypothetical protein
MERGWRKHAKNPGEIDIPLVAGGKLCYTEKKRTNPFPGTS